MTTRRVAEAITAYAASLDVGRSAVISPAGLWLLLASVASTATGERAERLAEVLGQPVDVAQAAARGLLADPHSAVGAALGVWARVALPGVEGPTGEVEPIPSQGELDTWAAEHTRGLIDRFPLEVDPATAILLATALVTQPSWDPPLRRTAPSVVTLDGALQAIVDTRAAGRVAVAVPATRDGIDVVSVVAAADVAPGDVWAAADEVVGLLGSGRLTHRRRPDELTDGHAWTVRRERRSSVHDEVWSTRLPMWSASVTTNFDDAPGVAEVVAAFADLVPELDGSSTCVQSCVAEYDESGFSAAAVTALAMRMSAMMPAERDVTCVEVSFDRPHALVAVARGGTWDGVPLFSCWVTPHTD